jgi:hypothetical protein
VSSSTLTLDFRPAENVSLMAEFRHDQAGADMYFGGAVFGGAVLGGAVIDDAPNRSTQDTLSVAATAWF